MACPLSAWPPCPVMQSHASQCIENTCVFAKMYALFQYGRGRPKSLFPNCDAKADSSRTTLGKHFIESTDLIFSAHFGVDIGTE